MNSPLSVRMRRSVAHLTLAYEATYHKKIAQSEWAHVRYVSQQAYRLFRGEFRKDGKTPEFHHSLDVQEILIRVFGIVDIFPTELAYLHDGLEIKPEEYARVQKRIGVFSSLLKYKEWAELLHLGVRMHTYFAHLKANRDEQERLVYEGLLNPEAVYSHSPEFNAAFSILHQDPVLRDTFLFWCIVVKLADRIAGWADFNYFKDPELATPVNRDDPVAVKRRQALIDLPAKIFRKTLYSMDTRLVQKLTDNRYQPIVNAYYSELERILNDHFVIDTNQFPTAKPLKEAAAAVMPDFLDRSHRHPLKKH